MSFMVKGHLCASPKLLLCHRDVLPLNSEVLAVIFPSAPLQKPPSGTQDPIHPPICKNKLEI